MRRCRLGEYEKKAPTPKADRVCDSCKPCGAGKTLVGIVAAVHAASPEQQGLGRAALLREGARRFYDGKRRPRSEGAAARGPGSAIKSAILRTGTKF